MVMLLFAHPVAILPGFAVLFPPFGLLSPLLKDKRLCFIIYLLYF